jgi:ABC-type transport system involved in multi-copper enzyme maturation permease subunit
MIARKTANELWPMTLVYLVVMQIILIPAIALWPDINVIGQKIKPFLGLTKILKEGFFREIIESTATYSDYYALQAFFKGANICGAAAAVLMGTGLIARERESRTLEFLLSRPVSASRILFEKFATAAVGVTVPIFLVGWSGIPLSAWLIDETLSFTAITLAALHCSLFILCILALTTLCSVIFRLQSHTAAVAGIVVVIQTTLFFIQTARKYSAFRLSDIEIYAPILAGERSLGDLFGAIQVWMLLFIGVTYLAADRLLRRITL